ncbi:MAG: phosphatase PAP2 family protein [Tissierellia bacterium]|nr:phosphatase PAP2 family protein [Tissierellia bacterium]
MITKFTNNIYTQRMVKALMFLLLSTSYTLVNRYVPHALDLVTPLDALIPQWPWTVFIYHLWYPTLWYLIFALRYDKDFDALLEHLILTKLFCVLTFILVPTIVSVRTMTPGLTLAEKALNLTYTIDGPYCAFPSSHVALATIAMYFALRHNHRSTRWIVFFQMCVILSTLTTKQHVIADVFGGAFYAMFVYYLLYKENLCLPLKKETIYKKQLTKVTSQL